MPLSEILTYLFGSTTLVSIYIAWRSRNSELKKSEANALESIDNIYDKMSLRVDKEMEKYQKIIDKQDLNIKKQDEEINGIKKLLNQYVSQCSICPNNKIQKP